jgi:polysaccharide export outer membrane protein
MTAKVSSNDARSQRVSVSVLALAGILGGSCLSAAAGEPPPASVPETAPATISSGAPAGASYVIGPGDSIQVFVWRNPELSVVVPVRPDGKISSPLVEDMVAVGKTPTELARDIEKVLGEYVRTPQVNIIVTNAQSAFNQVKVIGQVAHPQAIAYREGMTALDAMLAVGGLTNFAAGNRSRILRKDSKGEQQVIRVRLEALMKKGRATDNPALQPGDVLVVPEAVF